MQKKILFLVQLPPPVHGVSVTNKKILEIDSLSNGLFDISVLPLRFSDSIEEIDRLSIRKVIKTFSVAVDLFKHCVFDRPDLVYFTLSVIGKTFYRDLLYVAIMKLLRVDIIYHLHRVGVQDEAKRSRVRNTLYKWAFSGVKIIHLTPRLYEDISDYVDSSSCYYISNGIDDPKKILENITSNAFGQRIRLTFLSHMVAEKGVIILLAALGILRKRGLQYDVKFAGGRMSPECEKELNKAVAYNDAERSIEYIGPVYDDAKWTLLANTDIFVFPSLYDSFGIVLLEAMACSLPVVATIQGGIPDVVDDNITGFLVEKNNPEQLANKLEELIRDENLRKTMGNKGREKFESHYTNEVFEKNFVNTLEMALK